MKTLVLTLLLVLFMAGETFADSDGYGCYANGVLAFDQAFKDPTGLYLLTWGDPVGISKLIRVELPHPHSSYSQGIKCESDKITILLRGQPPAQNSRELTKYKMYLTEISLKNPNEPEIVSDVLNHYQSWIHGTKKEIEPLDGQTQIVTLPEPNLDLNGNRDEKEILLESNDSGHTYHLVFYQPLVVKAISTGSRVRVRSQPNTSATLVDLLANGESVEVRQQKELDGVWKEIVNCAGVSGWVSDRYLKGSTYKQVVGIHQRNLDGNNTIQKLVYVGQWDAEIVCGH